MKKHVIEGWINKNVDISTGSVHKNESLYYWDFIDSDLTDVACLVLKRSISNIKGGESQQKKPIRITIEEG